ncbi:hypothetical protein SADUNF_Sadunf14G0029300 [Salix dunnii]|uniref:Protein kinase domain-containing protein n=1 Tax=Salix dunnii TaxID=1413687 RepID=A0A835JDT6_9ROSI|nr:hypothetical protein SADUNF_Sadunf14G0029300 [Salix dunnii]
MAENSNSRSNYKVSHRSSGQLYTLRVINMKHGDIVGRPQVSPELNLLQRFDHPNIVKLQGRSFMDGESLSGKHVTNESHLSNISRPILAHNSIQPSNIWVDDSQNNVKIADFSVITNISQFPVDTFGNVCES